MCLRLGNSLAVQLGLSAFIAMAWLQSLVRELRSCKLAVEPKGEKKKKAKARFEGMECQAQEVGWKNKRKLKCNFGRSLTARTYAGGGETRGKGILRRVHSYPDTKK